MGNPLHDRRTPQDFAASGQVIEIAGKIGDFKRLAGIVEADLAALEAGQMPGDWRDTRIAGELRFGFLDAQGGVPALEGRLMATIDAVCQRCLAPCKLPLEVELRLLFAADEATAGGAGRYEVWEIDDDLLRPADVVEEALIMAMPYVAKHADDDSCTSMATDEHDRIGMTTPFANLKTQMNKEH